MSSPTDQVATNNYKEVPMRVFNVGADGLPSGADKNMAQYVLVSGSYTYLCSAPAGTALATAGWRISRVEDLGSGSSQTTWADGNTKFDNVATDPTTLTYS